MFRKKGKTYRILLGIFFTGWCFLPTLTAQSDLPFKSDQNTPFEFISNIEIFVEALPKEISVNQDFSLKLWGRVPDNYHIYSISSQGSYAPDSTQLLVNSDLLRAVSPLEESETEQIFDEAFEQKLQVHKHDFWLERKYRFKNSSFSGKYSINGSLIFQICSKRICSLPVSKPFTTTVVVIR